MSVGWFAKFYNALWTIYPCFRAFRRSSTSRSGSWRSRPSSTLRRRIPCPASATWTGASGAGWITGKAFADFHVKVPEFLINLNSQHTSAASLHQCHSAGFRIRQGQLGPGHPVPDGQQVAFADFHKRVLEFLIS